MAKVIIDRERKLVDVEMGGFIKSQEAARISTEIKEAFRVFGPGQALLLIDLIGFAPLNSDVLPVLRGLGRDVLTFFKKGALVQEWSMKLQNRTVIEPPPGYKLPTFQTREEALEYLLEE